MSKEDEIRIAAVGKTGAGKSTLGNALIGDESFIVGEFSDSETTQTTTKEGTWNGLKVKYADTPGLFDTKAGDGGVYEEIGKCVKQLSPGPDVVFCVINLDVRFTNEELNSVDGLSRIFGDDVTHYMIVVFTHRKSQSNRAEHEKRNIDRANTDFKTVLHKCSGRYNFIYQDNETDSKSDVDKIIELACILKKDNNNKHFDSTMYDQSVKQVKEQQEREADEKAEKEKKEKELEKKVQEIKEEKELLEIERAEDKIKQLKLEHQRLLERDRDQRGRSTKFRISLIVVLTLMIPVQSDSLFEWRNTTNPVIGTMRQRIALEWLYESKEPVTSMVFTRFSNSSDIVVPVAKWTLKDGFKPDPFISTVLLHTIHEIHGTNEKKVSLILEDPIHIDYDLQYNCQVNFGDEVSRNLTIALKALRPKWTHSEYERHATLGTNVTFLWEYEYPYEVIAVFIRRERKREKIEIGYWYQGEFTDMDQFIKRVAIKKTPNDNKRGEQISLTLQNVTMEDFGWDYVCQLTLGDGEQLLNSTKLKERDVQWNAAPPFVYRTDSKTSTATKSLVGDRTIIILLVIVSSIISHRTRLCYYILTSPLIALYLWF